MIQSYRYRPGDLLAVRIGTDYAASDRYAEVAQDGGESLTLQDVTGRELTGSIVSARLMTDEERVEWENYGREGCAGCGELRDLVLGVQPGEHYCGACALALVVFAKSEAA